MTSPTFFLQNSWETVGSENHLSKPDVREIAKAYPRIPAGGHKSSRISQTAEVDYISRYCPLVFPIDCLPYSCFFNSKTPPCTTCCDNCSFPLAHFLWVGFLT
uniref:Uncharacterized protein n=1 Tax=Corvus moneduloides TaxID=1196302 RepID=A0A8C3EJJ8_CORMO